MRHTLPVAVHLFFKRDADILLLRRFNTGYEDGNYSVPAGHLELGETVTQCAIREANEEVGVTLHPGDLEVVHVMNRKGNDERIDFFVQVKSWDGEPTNCEPHKCDELSWSTLDHLPTNVIPYVRHAIANVSAHIRFSEFGW